GRRRDGPHNQRPPPARARPARPPPHRPPRGVRAPLLVMRGTSVAAFARTRARRPRVRANAATKLGAAAPVCHTAARGLSSRTRGGSTARDAVPPQLFRRKGVITP